MKILQIIITAILCAAYVFANGIEATTFYKQAQSLEKEGASPEDQKKAFDLTLKAAKLNHLDAMWDVGHRYYAGIGVEIDYNEGIKWTRKAVVKGHPTAMHNYARYLERGVGIKKDIKKAIHWYEKAVENGEPVSAHNLAQIYDWGEGVKADTKKAMKYYRIAAMDAGVFESMINLGAIYYNGEKVSKSLSKAFAWFMLATFFDKSAWPYVKKIKGEMNVVEKPLALYQYEKLKKEFFSKRKRLKSESAKMGSKMGSEQNK